MNEKLGFFSDGRGEKGSRGVDGKQKDKKTEANNGTEMDKKKINMRPTTMARKR